MIDKKWKFCLKLVNVDGSCNNQEKNSPAVTNSEDEVMVSMKSIMVAEAEPCCDHVIVNKSPVDDLKVSRSLDSNNNHIEITDMEEIPPETVFDTHCHLEFIQKRMGSFAHLSDCMELDGLNLKNKFAGCIVNFCQPSEWSGGRDEDQVSSLILAAACDSRVGVTLGCHPHFADQMSAKRWLQMERLIAQREYPGLTIVAAGECGLDYSKKNRVSRDIQAQTFRRHLELALKYRLPIILHIRDATEDGLQALKSVGVPSDYPIHLHCFTSSLEVASMWLSSYSELKIGVTGLITYPQAWQLRKVVKEIPLTKLLLETDAPYFLPHKALTRVHNCSFPGHVFHVAAAVAEVKGVSLIEVLQQNLKNSQLIYRKFFLSKPTIKTFKAISFEKELKVDDKYYEEDIVKVYKPKLLA